ncbi:MAG: restriction endonuclease, partial [Desulfobulbaceae bacterium]|nr:restriction endonuclease [Desulfobulbaceae bacterium]
TLEIGLGVEVGFNPDRIRQLQSFLDRYHWDRVGISYHFLDVHGEHLNLLSRKKHNIAAYDGVGVERILDAYFSGLRVAVEELPGDVLCHLDAVLRYHPDAKDFDFFTPACDLLDRIAEKGMSLEVNTSGYPIRDQPFPSIDILKAAAGRNITLVAGSDAHRPADVGRYFDRLSVIVKEIQKIR